MADYYDNVISSREIKRLELGTSESQYKTRVEPDGSTIVEMDCKYDRWLIEAFIQHHNTIKL